MGWSRMSSIGRGEGNLLLVKRSQALTSWIKKSSLFFFCKFLCLLYLRIWFCLKRAKTWLEFSFKSIFNRYSMRSFQRAFVGFNNIWIHFIFRKFNWVSMSKMSKECFFFLFNLLFDIRWNSIYLNYVPKFE